MKPFPLILLAPLAGAGCWAADLFPATPEPATAPPRTFILEVQTARYGAWGPTADHANTRLQERRLTVQTVPVEVRSVKPFMITNPPVTLTLNQVQHPTGRIGDFLTAWSEINPAAGDRLLLTCTPSGTGLTNLIHLLTEQASNVASLSDPAIQQRLADLLPRNGKPVPKP